MTLRTADGEALGDELGRVQGKALGATLGAALGELLGESLGQQLCGSLGEPLGEALGRSPEESCPSLKVRFIFHVELILSLLPFRLCLSKSHWLLLVTHSTAKHPASKHAKL